MEVVGSPLWADEFLAWLDEFWQEVPAVARDFDRRDSQDQLDYVTETVSMHQDRLHMLQGWALAGLLSPEQQARYEALVALIKRNRPLLDEIMHG